MIAGFLIGVVGHLQPLAVADRGGIIARLPRRGRAAAGPERVQPTSPSPGAAASALLTVLRRIAPWAASTSSTCRKSLYAQGGGQRARPRLGAARAAAPDARRPDRRAASSGRRAACVFEGWDASGKGGAIKRLVAQLDPRHVRVVQFAAPTPRREAPPLPVAVLAGRCRAGAGWRSSTAPGTAGCWSSGSRASPPASSGCAPTTRSTASSGSLADEGMILVKLWLHISEEEQLKRFERREKRPAEGLEADRRGLAQPREARRTTTRRSRTCSPAPTSRTRRGA